VQGNFKATIAVWAHAREAQGCIWTCCPNPNGPTGEPSPQDYRYERSKVELKTRHFGCCTSSSKSALVLVIERNRWFSV
jgi:hypothetical protein